jgi:hypothetical protein
MGYVTTRVRSGPNLADDIKDHRRLRQFGYRLPGRPLVGDLPGPVAAGIFGQSLRFPHPLPGVPQRFLDHPIDPRSIRRLPRLDPVGRIGGVRAVDPVGRRCRIGAVDRRLRVAVVDRRLRDFRSDRVLRGHRPGPRGGPARPDRSGGRRAGADKVHPPGVSLPVRSGSLTPALAAPRWCEPDHRCCAGSR